METYKWQLSYYWNEEQRYITSPERLEEIRAITWKGEIPKLPEEEDEVGFLSDKWVIEYFPRNILKLMSITENIKILVETGVFIRNAIKWQSIPFEELVYLSYETFIEEYMVANIVAGKK
jgi:hypothetical protein